ncbi:hypothetical protein PFICI_12140 [Pestalotiopsis fici W106-1]|uniref:Uncharacterized protein n=1 Tax=Pestalotiopsis fici (strain W106-1 / CGMCC3.15140) TaxID=1229662 RepID=W3WSC5_PESFW|nr:uncharacterized protein PFICI_12140 [Pestalotiopsis fici W106-1]ETS76753.1 hypothetical protein PFICI_12140 [Pestalotiopsis fici W106-1]
MVRDSKRGHGQWRGCYGFQDKTTQGSEPKRSPSRGLSMGERYYYYYEFDGTSEEFNPSEPFTTRCPYLPGQQVNILDVPVEQTLKRTRSASMNSLRPTDFKTMDPQDKYITPRPAPTAPLTLGPRRGTSTGIRLKHKSSTRSLSPASVPGWTGKAKRLFGLRPSSRSSDRDWTPETVDSEDSTSFTASTQRPDEGTRSTTPSEGSRSRDMSPESLRRFLLDNKPVAQSPVLHSQKLTIPDDIVEENEDDDNFATSATSEHASFNPLSPPPFKRTQSSPAMAGLKTISTSPMIPNMIHELTKPQCRDDSALEDLRRGSIASVKLSVPPPRLPCSTTSSAAPSPISPQSFDSPHNNNFSFFEDMTPVDHGFSFFDDLPEDDKRISGVPEERFRQPSLTAYSLPHSGMVGQKDLPVDAAGRSFGSPSLVSGDAHEIDSSSLLSVKGIDAGFDDLVNELSWIARAI